MVATLEGMREGKTLNWDSPVVRTLQFLTAGGVGVGFNLVGNLYTTARVVWPK